MNSKLLLTLTLLLFSALPHLSHASSAGVSPDSLNKGLVGHWTFDGKNMISNVKDSSGQNNNGALVGFGATSTAVVPGKIGQGLKFDGVDDYVNAGSASSLDNAFSNGMPATYSAWIYPTKANATSYIISKTIWGDMALYLNTTLSPTSLRFYVSTDMSPIDVYSTTAIPLNRWTHVAIAWDGVVGAGGSRNFYINGVLTGKVAVSNGSGTVGNFSTLNMSIGSRTDGTAGSFFPGSLDDVRIYNRALSATEVKQLYNLGSARVNQSLPDIESGLVGHWTFDGKDTPWTSATAGTAKDKSGNNNTGTLTSMSRATAPTIGKIGQGLKFDGVDDYVTMSRVVNNFPFTISGWVKTYNSNAGTIISEAGSGGVYYSSIGVSDGKAFAKLQYDGYPQIATGISDISNKWSLVTAVYYSTGINSNSTIKLYVNGVSEAVSSDSNLAAIFNRYNNTTIGRVSTSTPGTYINGSLDDVRIYSRALSASEIKELYNLGSAKINESVPSIERGLVGHWTFDGKNMISNVKDTSGQNNHGGLVGFGATSTAVVPGKIGQGLKFDGVNDYVKTVNASDITNYPFTLSGWVKPTVTPSTANIGSIVQLLFTTSGNEYFGIVFGGQANKYCMSARNPSSSQTECGGVAKINTWAHVTAVFTNATTRQLYVGGVAVTPGSVEVTFPTHAMNQIAIGRFNDASPNYEANAVIDDVRIYNRALSASEVKQLYNLGR